MRRGGDLEARVSRIEETMATRDDIAELRAAIEAGGTPRGSLRRRLKHMLGAAALTLGFVVLILAFAR